MDKWFNQFIKTILITFILFVLYIFDGIKNSGGTGTGDIGVIILGVSTVSFIIFLIAGFIVEIVFFIFKYIVTHRGNKK